MVGISAALALALALLASAWVGRQTVRPVRNLTSAVEEVGRGADLSRRVPVPQSGDELSQLGRAFNEALSSVEQMYTELQAIIQKQRQFVNDASHELRTPLTTVSSCVELASSQPDMATSDRTQILADAVHESHRMAALLDDLLILASVDAGEQLRDDPFSWNDLLESAIASGRRACAPRSLTIELEPNLGGGHGDVNALRRVIANLFDNVARHTPETATMIFRARVAGAEMKLSLCDTGPGVAVEDQQRIFERFVRLDPARTGANAGLGLAIVSSVVAAHDGSVAARSAHPTGLCVEIALPHHDA